MWTKEESKRWKEKHANICIDCGQPCSCTAKRCRTCECLRRRVLIPPNCVDCGKPINPRARGRARNTAAKRCPSCTMKHRWAIGELRAVHNQAKQERAKTRRGRKYLSAGYIFIYQPDHPRASKGGYVREHILAWEQAHGKPLPKGWIVHHLNGIKDDNHPKNLVGLPNKKHYLVLQAKAKRIQELEALLDNQHQLL